MQVDNCWTPSYTNPKRRQWTAPAVDTPWTRRRSTANYRQPPPLGVGGGGSQRPQGLPQAVRPVGDKYRLPHRVTHGGRGGVWKDRPNFSRCERDEVRVRRPGSLVGSLSHMIDLPRALLRSVWKTSSGLLCRSAAVSFPFLVLAVFHPLTRGRAEMGTTGSAPVGPLLPPPMQERNPAGLPPPHAALSTARVRGRVLVSTRSIHNPCPTHATHWQWPEGGTEGRQWASLRK